MKVQRTLELRPDVSNEARFDAIDDWTESLRNFQLTISRKYA